MTDKKSKSPSKSKQSSRTVTTSNSKKEAKSPPWFFDGLIKAPQNLPTHTSEILQNVFGLEKNMSALEIQQEEEKQARLPKD